MEKKIIIIRVKFDLVRPIEFLNESLNYSSERYYSVNEKDTEIVSANDGLKCTVVFVIFKPNETAQKDDILRIYVGNGHICKNDVRWIVNYTIAAKIESNLIINNFISNSELDLRNDFNNYSYVIIENNEELIQQIRFVINTPYTVTQKPISKQQYCHIAKEKSLHKYSQYNENCKRPIGTMGEQESRSEFQRDYDRIVHAKSYRRLVDKAQIFTSSKGDHYRTRLTHTLEVAQIARAIAVGLNLNVELAEAIALAHDLGHTPFGHQGERTLDDIMKNRIPVIKYIPDDKNFFGGFKHNFQGLRVANFLEEKYIDFEGLDLSYQVLEGILKHTSVKLKDCYGCNTKEECKEKCFDLMEYLPYGEIHYLYPEYPMSTTLEGQIISIADEIAQRSHDLDDSFSSGVMSVDELANYLSLQKMSALREPIQRIQEQIKNASDNNRIFVNAQELQHSRIVSTVINFFIGDVIQYSTEKMNNFKENEFFVLEHRFNERLIDFSYNGKVLCDYLEKIISKKVINSSEVVQFDNKAALIVRGLFEAYYNNPKLLHAGTLRKIYIETRKHTNEVIDFLNGDRDMVSEEISKIINTDLSKMSEEKSLEYAQKKKILVRAIADYISGMTDSYAKNEYDAIYK